MISFTQSLQRRGGLAATNELYADGHTRGGVRLAVQKGWIERVRQGWFALPGIHPLLLEGVRVGGRVTALTALDIQGFWSYPTDDLHVAVPAHGSRLRTRTDKSKRLADTPLPHTCVHWRDGGDGDRFQLSPIASIADALACQTPEAITAVADSVLHTYPGLRGEWNEFVDAAPACHQSFLRSIDGVCESGTESIFWMRVQQFGLTITRQVMIERVGRVDFRIGSKLIVEVDSKTYHTDPAAFERDRARDAILSALGYRVLRFSYVQVMFNWPMVEAALIGALVRGDHY